MINFGTWRAGYCLEAVWQAYKRHGASTGRSAATAYIGWQKSDGKHEGDRNPPAGVPVWWGPKAGNNAGDVVISLGDGRVVATDWPRNGVIGITTIDARTKQIGRPYLGWTERIFDVPIEYGAGGGGVVPGASQRTAGPNGVRRRKAPNTQSAEGEMLAPGTVGNFTGWIRGEVVEGNAVWFQGISGDWFWSGGFVEGPNVTGLKDLNPALPTNPTERTAGPNGARRRTKPTSQSPEAGEMLAPGVVGNFDGWTHGEKVDGNDVWFRGISGNWFWSGGFKEGPLTDGLPLVPSAPVDPNPPVVVPVDPNNPKGLPTYTPVYPGAKIGLVAPLTLPRGEKGIPPQPVENKIDLVQEHHTGVLEDQLGWFSTDNSRGSCPNWFIRPNGDVFELIRPGKKPALAGPEWNWRSLGWEIQSVDTGDWHGTPEQFEAVAQLLAWIHSYDGKILDGTPVTFPLDREHFKAHRELVATLCPGDWWFSRMDAQLARAKEIYDEKYNPDPEVPEVPDQGDILLARAKALIEENTKLLQDIVSWAEGE